MGANAQTSVPLFVANQVLTASQQNISAATGVPVFATTVTRDAAFGGANKILAEGQLCYLESTDVVQYYTGSAWATVGPISSKINQLLTTTLTTDFVTSSATYGNITGLTVAITPTLATSKIYVTANLSIGTDNSVGNFFARLAVGGSAISGAVGTAAGSRTLVTNNATSATTATTHTIAMAFLDSPATTSALTYSVQAASIGGSNIYINRSYTDTNTSAFPRGISTITVMEVLA
jgi:hypothetical protein